MNVDKTKSENQQSNEMKPMSIRRVEFDSLEGLNQAFEAMTAMICCGNQGGPGCTCGSMGG